MPLTLPIGAPNAVYVGFADHPSYLNRLAYDAAVFMDAFGRDPRAIDCLKMLLAGYEVRQAHFGETVRHLAVGLSFQRAIDSERVQNIAGAVQQGWTSAADIDVSDQASRFSQEEIQAIRDWEKERFPLFVECSLASYAHAQYIYFSPSDLLSKGLVTPQNIDALKRGQRLLSIGAGPAFLEQCLVEKFGVPHSQIEIADIDEGVLPGIFQRHVYDMTQEWPSLGSPFDIIIFPESAGVAMFKLVARYKETYVQEEHYLSELFSLFQRALPHLRDGGEIRISGHGLKRGFRAMVEARLYRKYGLRLIHSDSNVIAFRKEGKI